MSFKRGCSHGTGERFIQKLRVLVTSWENTLFNCKNLAIVYKSKFNRKRFLQATVRILSHLWVYLIISLAVMRVLARLANSCHDFCLLKTSCWLVLLASLAFSVRLLQKKVSVLNHFGEQLLPQGFCLQFELMCLFCRGCMWHIPQPP